MDPAGGVPGGRGRAPRRRGTGGPSVGTAGDGRGRRRSRGGGGGGEPEDAGGGRRRGERHRAIARRLALPVPAMWDRRRGPWRRAGSGLSSPALADQGQPGIESADLVVGGRLGVVRGRIGGEDGRASPSSWPAGTLPLGGSPLGRDVGARARRRRSRAAHPAARSSSAPARSGSSCRRPPARRRVPRGSIRQGLLTWPSSEWRRRRRAGRRVPLPAPAASRPARGATKRGRLDIGGPHGSAGAG